MGCANISSIIQSPSYANTNEYVPFNYIDTSDWTINSFDMTKIVCANEGSWEFIVKYMLTNITYNNIYDNVTCWIRVNDVDLDNTGASASVNLSEGSNVLIISYCGYFNENDKIQFGIRSISTDNVLNIGCNSSFTENGDVIPSVLVTCTKIKTFANLYSSSVVPVNSNNNEYVPLAYLDNLSDWKLDANNNTTIECLVAGRWQYNVMYHMNGLSDQTDASNCMLSGWVEKQLSGGSFITMPNTIGNSYITTNSINKVMMITYTDKYNVGDKIRFGVRSSNVNNIICTQYRDPTDVTTNSVYISASKVISYMNLYSNINVPSNNELQYIPLTNFNVDDDWQLDSSNNTIMICGGTATWKFTAKYNISCLNQDGGNITCVVKINDIEQYITYSTKSLSVTNGKDSLILTYVGSFNQSQTVSFGIKSTNNNNIGCISYNDPNTGYAVVPVTLSAVKVAVPLGPIEISTFSPSYATSYSTSSIPTAVNTLQYVPIDYIDTSRWFVSNMNNTKLVCNSDGTWLFTVEYQISNITADLSSGSFVGCININGVTINNVVSLTINDLNGTNSLVGTYSGNFCAGDIVQFGITYNASSLNMQCISYTDYTGVFTPSVSISAIQVNSIDIMTSNSIIPTISNTNQYIVSNSGTSNNWSRDNTGALTCLQASSYQILMQYQIVNNTMDISANDATVYGWIEKLDISDNIYIPVPNTLASGYTSKNGSVYTFSISYSAGFNKNDKIRFGIKSLSLICVCNTTKLTITQVLGNSNIYTIYNAPLNANTNEMIQLYNIDSNDWKIDTLDNTLLTCQRTGSWQFIVQHRISNILNEDLSANNATISSYVFVNGTFVENSNVSGYVSKAGGHDVLTNIYTGYFNNNDTIQFAINSISQNGNLNVSCISYEDASGNTINPVSITASKFSDVINFQSAIDSTLLKTSQATVIQSYLDAKQNIYSGVLNAYSKSNNITSINTNIYVQLDYISSNEWQINPTDSTQIICMNSGPWQFIIEYMISNNSQNISDASNCMVSGWISINGLIETASYTYETIPLPGRKSFILAYMKQYNAGDVVQFGINSNNINISCQPYFDSTKLNIPSVRITANNSNTGTNFLSNSNLPTLVNTNQYIKFNPNSFIFWMINPGDPTELICRLNANWQFIVQYTVLNTSATDVNAIDSELSGWIEQNNGVNNMYTPIKNCKASCCAYKAGSKTTLVFSLVANFKVGDKLRFGIRSNSSNTLNAVCKSIQDIFGTPTESVIVSVNAVSSFSNMYSLTNSPENINTDEVIPLNTFDNSSWVTDKNNILVCMEQGSWQFVINYNLANINNMAISADARISAFVTINNVLIDNIDTTTYVNASGEKSVLTLCFSRGFNLGDVILFGIRASTLSSQTLNVQCQRYIDASENVIPSMSCTATKLSNNIGTSLNIDNNTVLNGDVSLGGLYNKLGFFGTNPIVKQTVATFDGNDSLENLYTMLRNYGLIV